MAKQISKSAQKEEKTHKSVSKSVKKTDLPSPAKSVSPIQPGKKLPSPKVKSPQKEKKTVVSRVKNTVKPKTNKQSSPAAKLLNIKTPVQTKKKRIRKPHATRPTEAELLIIEERRALVLDLRKARTSIRQISDHLRQKGYEHYSPATVHADLAAELAELRERQQNSVEDIVTLELETLDALQFCLWANTIRKGDTFGVYAILAIMERRAKLLGLDKQKPLEIDFKEGLAKLFGCSPEELPDERP